MRWLIALIALGILASEFLGRVATGQESDAPNESDYYRLTTFELPEGEVIEACGLQVVPDGRLAVCSRRGDIFMIADPLAETVKADQVKLYARGLHEPLSLGWHDGWLYATQRPEVTRIKDEDGDGTADRFETVADGWGISGDYHEYAFASKPEKDGSMLITLCLTGSFSSQVPYRGWAMKVTPAGETIPFASGVRSPGGMGANLQGDVFYTDNQGPWNGTCGLKVLKKGSFVGHPGGFQWYDQCADVMGKRPEEPKTGSRMHIECKRIPELIPTAIKFPYDKMGKSASGIACDTSKGKFGPFAGQLFVGDQSQSTVMRVDLEVVDGVYQGACFPFRKGFASGNVAVEMGPSGSLFVGGTNRGWGSVGPREFAVERLDWTGKIPTEIQTMKLTPDGFDLTFTQPMTQESATHLASYRISTYTYEYRSDYGSPEVDATEPKIIKAELSRDGMRLRLTVDALQQDHVHELHCDGLRSTSGLPLLHTAAYYTLNRFAK
jgi:glucose/arabinose dehydrogenase